MQENTIISGKEVQSLLKRIRILEEQIYEHSKTIDRHINFIVNLNKIIGLEEYSNGELNGILGFNE